MPSGHRATRQDQIGSLLQEFSSTAEDLSRAFASRHGMHHTAARAILELRDAAESGTPMTAGGLGQALGLTPASVTALVDRMVAAGHVRRNPDPSDRRRVLLVVELSAEELGERFFRPVADDLAALMTDYSEQDLDLIEGFLRQTTDAIRAHLARPL